MKNEQGWGKTGGCDENHDIFIHNCSSISENKGFANLLTYLDKGLQKDCMAVTG